VAGVKPSARAANSSLAPLDSPAFQAAAKAVAQVIAQLTDMDVVPAGLEVVQLASELPERGVGGSEPLPQRLRQRVARNLRHARDLAKVAFELAGERRGGRDRGRSGGLFDAIEDDRGLR
jgi:hypothetical protein